MYRVLHYIILFFCTLLFQTDNFGYGQRVGLVLSGGGATGLTHIGVIKALEEKGIPIDYITGTSAGALVGSMYASGFSIEEIEKYVLSDKFLHIVNGKLEKEFNTLFYNEESDPSLIEIPFTKDSIFSKSLPLSLLKPFQMDFEMLKLLETTSVSTGNNFDSLFIPFRCVASDITNKKATTFSDGNLNAAVRASMTYPFYINPIAIDGILYFDGGLYNNFPIDVMYHDFLPDYIIGSNVSSLINPPKEDDVMSQVFNMMTFPRKFDLPCKDGVIINPETNVSTFNFESSKKAIDDGYYSTIKYIDSIILPNISRRVTKEELNNKRQIFRSKIYPLDIQKIHTDGVNSKKSYFIKSLFYNEGRDSIISAKRLEKNYYRVSLLPHVSYLYPTLKLDTNTFNYDLNLKVKQSKDFRIEFGGYFSSRPVNTGYVGLTYLNMDKFGYRIKLDSYFGKFYSSIKGIVDFQFPSKFPVTVSPYFIANRWDYYRSSTAFFEDVKPSYILQKELYSGVKLKIANGNVGISELDFAYFINEDNYYQTKNFLSKDTADKTYLEGVRAFYEFRSSTLDRKQFSSKGHKFLLKLGYAITEEKSKSGTTNPIDYEIRSFHNWMSFHTEYQKYFFAKSKLRVGFHVLGSVTTQPILTNYTATMLNLNVFSPLEDSKTLLLENYRSPLFVGGGYNFVYSIRKNLDLRLDLYLYEPMIKLRRDEFGQPFYSKLEFKYLTFMGALSATYHSPIGPFRVSVNYLPNESENIFSDSWKWKESLIFQLSYGYIMFNKRALK